MVPVALSIAGSDPSGGAGIQTDIKTFQRHGVYGQAAISLLTVQNSCGVRKVVPVSPALIAEQVEALLSDMPPQAVKTGALAEPAAALAVARVLRDTAIPLVVDPILAPTAGAAFSREDMLPALREQLLPWAALVTPNAEEASWLTGIPVADVEGAEQAAKALLETGVRAVLVKGGHLAGDPVDLFISREGDYVRLAGSRVSTPHTHGTGCTLAAAITARLARGSCLRDAVLGAKAWLNGVLSAPSLGLGKCRGPLNLLSS